jgi:RHS repeat-associated protein
MTGAWDLSLGGDWRSVTYDGVTETRAHDAAHELTARNAQPLAYDQRGNLTTDSEGRVFTWDSENRLTSVFPTTLTNGALAATFVYDTQWRRVGKKEYRWSAGAWHLKVDSHYIYDDWNLVAEEVRKPQTSFTNYFVWGQEISGSLQGAGGIGGALCVARNTARFYYHYQANGNVMALTDADGAVAARYVYSPYGSLLSATGSVAMSNPIRFSTKYTDDETGLVYYGYRYYSPGLGRWVSKDPLEEEGSDLTRFSAEGLRRLVDVEYWRDKRTTAKGFFDVSAMYVVCGNAPTDRYDYLGLFDTGPCEPANRIACNNDGLRLSRGWPGYTCICRNVCFIFDVCKCFGVCNLIMQTNPGSSGANYTCTYNCGTGGGIKTINSAVPCATTGLWGLN